MDEFTRFDDSKEWVKISHEGQKAGSIQLHTVWKAEGFHYSDTSEDLDDANALKFRIKRRETPDFPLNS